MATWVASDSRLTVKEKERENESKKVSSGKSWFWKGPK